MSIAVHSAAERAGSEGIGDILERVLDKGVVVAGDIAIEVVGVELLTIKLRLIVASTERAEELGIDWWRHDPYLSSAARGRTPPRLEAIDEALGRALDEKVRVEVQRPSRDES